MYERDFDRRRDATMTRWSVNKQSCHWMQRRSPEDLQWKHVTHSHTHSHTHKQAISVGPLGGASRQRSSIRRDEWWSDGDTAEWIRIGVIMPHPGAMCAERYVIQTRPGRHGDKLSKWGPVKRLRREWLNPEAAVLSGPPSRMSILFNIYPPLDEFIVSKPLSNSLQWKGDMLDSWKPALDAEKMSRMFLYVLTGSLWCTFLLLPRVETFFFL